MDQTFQSFRKFNDKETAEDFAEVLRDANIMYRLEEDLLVFDATFANHPLNKEYIIKLNPDDFIKASNAYEIYFQKHLDEVESDYYLFQFTDDELKEIILKPDEWGGFDYQLAQKLLKQKGVEISDTEKESIKRERYQEISRPGKENNGLIILIYLICLMGIPVTIISMTSIPLYFFGASVITGWVWGYAKKTLPDGKRAYLYNEHVRKHGRIIFIMGVGIFILFILVVIFLPFWSR